MLICEARRKQTEINDMEKMVRIVTKQTKEIESNSKKKQNAYIETNSQRCNDLQHTTSSSSSSQP